MQQKEQERRALQEKLDETLTPTPPRTPSPSPNRSRSRKVAVPLPVPVPVPLALALALGLAGEVRGGAPADARDGLGAVGALGGRVGG